MLGALLVGQFIQVITLLAIVLLHELGHVAAALWYGWRVRRIELLPFGGVAETDEWGTTEPRAEFVVALAGPMVNALLIVLSYVLEHLGIWSSVWTAFFVYSNLVIGGFNLLPIWPLDGGRIVQIICSLFLPYRQTILLSIGLSVIGAVMLLVWSLSFQPTPHLNGLAVAFYLLFSSGLAYRQRHYHFMRFLLARQACFEARGKEWPETLVSISPSVTVGHAVKQLRRNMYHFFMVQGKSLPHAILSEEELLACYFDGRKRNCTVAELLR
jgi:stage IV sporulation protein FB